MGNPTTFAEFMQRMGEAFPDAVVDEDNDGQMVIYTGLRIQQGAEGEDLEGVEAVVPFDEAGI